MSSDHQSGWDSPYLWVYPTENPELQKDITQEFSINPVIAQILISRGLTKKEVIHQFLYAKLPDLLDPFLFKQMPCAVSRIVKAIDNNESIMIYGDNDVDGMTGTALLKKFLCDVGAECHFYVSTPGSIRKELIIEAIDFAKQNNCKLLITVDCGITSASEIQRVIEEGVDVIITDHHEPTDAIPHCVATLNPKLINDNYPNREITGVGVAFKLAHGVTNELISSGKIPASSIDLKHYLDLVTLGTISDMGVLLGENRIFVRYGLDLLRESYRTGVKELATVCGLEGSEISTATIASKIAPRLNSLGRIADPKKGVEMLLMDDAEEAKKMALELDLNNVERQRIERTMSADVQELFLNSPEIFQNRAIVLESSEWHPGVIPILSTRTSKAYNRPTISIAIDSKNGVAKGSIRSIKEFPVLSFLNDCADILLDYGGHDFAAGITIKEENIPEFKKRFIEVANKNLDDKDIAVKLNLDSEVAFEYLTFNFMETMSLLEPHGNGNTSPILYAECSQTRLPRVIGNNHLKFYLEQKGRQLEGIAFGMANRQKALRKKGLTLLVAFTPQINIFQKKSSIQLRILDVKVKEKEKDS